ncbi:hypothetical protein Nizo2766_1833 [Lactiplantibacillus plantarum]|nr:hypothetical protein Nizo2766_1833 [Lactiplantibacillus plantarum]
MNLFILTVIACQRAILKEVRLIISDNPRLITITRTSRVCKYS